MLSAAPRPSRFITALLTLIVLAAFGPALRAQDAPAVHVGDKVIKGVPDDWTHHRVHFGDPGTAEDALKNGTYDHWLQTVNDPRYVFQQLKRHRDARGPSANDVHWRQFEDGLARKYARSGHHNQPGAGAIQTDWNEPLGTSATGGLAAGQYPAKYTFSATTESSTDFVVFPTGNTPTTKQATIAAIDSIYGSSPAVEWAYNTGGSSNLSPVLSLLGDQVAYVQLNSSNQAQLVILRPSTTSGGPIYSTTATLIPTATSESASAYNNGSGTLCTAPCYVALTFQKAATGGTATPNDTNSSPYYDYATDTLYVGDNSGQIHKFTPVFSGTPTEIVTTSWPEYVGAAVTLTSPVLYPSGSIGNVYFGSSATATLTGKLYEVPATGGSYTVSTANLTATGSTGIVDSPIIDTNTTTNYVMVMVGDYTGGTTNAAIQFNISTGITGTPTVGTFGSGNTAYTIYDGDFDNAYKGGATTGNYYVCGIHRSGGGNAEPELFQIPMNSFSGAANEIQQIVSGASGACSPVTEFDNAGNSALGVTHGATINNSSDPVTFAVSSNSSIPTGNYIQIDSEIMLVTGTGTGTVTAARAQLGTTIATHTGAGNVNIPGVDYIYFSVTANGTTGPSALQCTGACLYSYAVGDALNTYVPAAVNFPFSNGTVPTNGVAEGAGTSGIIIDNDSTVSGASQIYFTRLGASTAIQTSQTAP